VIVGSRRNWLGGRRDNTVFLRIDDERLGEFAAERLSRLGAFNSAAFVPAAPGEFWGELRGRGFCAAMKKHKLDVRVYRGDADGSIGGFIDRLPKPAAVFAASDKIAFSVVSALRNPGAVIPGRVVLLGVDNDELMCNSVTPRLSSINPDHYEEGAVAQRELALLMRARNPRPVKTILCGKMDLVSRESTVHLAPAAKILSRALDYILRHAVEGITPDMVAAHIGVSRRLLDLRFRELHPRTVAQSILDVKLEAVKRLLAETEMPIGDIAGKCGFANSNHLKNVFCSRFGVSMRTFRQSAAGVSG
jgi:LacI family transcriptional regulator